MRPDSRGVQSGKTLSTIHTHSRSSLDRIPTNGLKDNMEFRRSRAGRNGREARGNTKVPSRVCAPRLPMPHVLSAPICGKLRPRHIVPTFTDSMLRCRHTAPPNAQHQRKLVGEQQPVSFDALMCHEKATALTASTWMKMGAPSDPEHAIPIDTEHLFRAIPSRERIAGKVCDGHRWVIRESWWPRPFFHRGKGPMPGASLPMRHCKRKSVNATPQLRVNSRYRRSTCGMGIGRSFQRTNIL